MIANRTDHYARVTNAIVADLERGVRPWLKPWSVEHASGRITRPLRANGQPYKGVNVLALWDSALSQNFIAPIWMTFKQAKELGADVRKSSRGTPVVYADRITKTETGDDGQETERGIYFLKGYTVFNVEQIDGLRRHASGDWGDLFPEDVSANDEALRNGGRLLSAYGSGEHRFWIITESDRSVTTVLLPDDY